MLLEGRKVWQPEPHEIFQKLQLQSSQHRSMAGVELALQYPSARRRTEPAEARITRAWLKETVVHLCPYHRRLRSRSREEKLKRPPRCRKDLYLKKWGSTCTFLYVYT